MEVQMVAWLITWEWVGEHAKVENKVAAILNYRIKGETVRDLVELLYVNNQYSLSERAAYAKNKKNNPYPAQFDTLGGVPWTERIFCGHNPYLYGRHVDGLRIHVNENDEETLIWSERPKPNPPF